MNSNVTLLDSEVPDFAETDEYLILKNEEEFLFDELTDYDLIVEEDEIDIVSLFVLTEQEETEDEDAEEAYFRRLIEEEIEEERLILLRDYPDEGYETENDLTL